MNIRLIGATVAGSITLVSLAGSFGLTAAGMSGGFVTAIATVGAAAVTVSCLALPSGTAAAA